VNVNAHELAHQWFGDLITAKESKHHWLQEGFATYYALLAEKEVFGEDYFYNELYESALLLEQASENDTIPILNEKASSLTFYKKGAWALHVLRSDIGAKKFNQAVQLYLEKYAYKNVETDDFLQIVKKVSNYNVVAFKKKWLETSGFSFESVVPYLRKNKSVEKLIAFNTAAFDTETVFDSYVSILKSNIFYTLKQELVYNYENLPLDKQINFLRLALNSNDLKVRQAVAEVLKRIPFELKTEFETLLNDKSYVTREIALFRLWTNFKDERDIYLNSAKSWETTNTNLKIAILTLDIVGVKNEVAKNKSISELESYMKAPYESHTREMAIETAIQLEIVSNEVIKELINATLHHKWQFVKYGKEKLREFFNNSKYDKLFNSLDLNPIQKNRFQDLKENLKH
jgi:aminopeptidase N